ncbi:MAG: HEAT repeat domain-containing protein [Aggregatilineales bacterium]
MTEGSIYISYHTRDYEFAHQLADDLITGGMDIWFDRLCIAPTDVWTPAITEVLQTTATAIVIASKHYARTPYCQQELTHLRDRNCSLIFVWLYKPDDPALSAPAAANMNIQLENWRDDSLYQSAFDMLHGLLKNVQPTPIYLTDEAIYLLRVISELEKRFLSTLTALTQIRTDQSEIVDGVPMRPRGHSAQVWLQQGEYRLQERLGSTHESGDDPAETLAQPTASADGIALELAIENVLEWIFIRPQVVFMGESGVGKSNILYYVALVAAHYRVRKQREYDYPLPLLIDLVGWQEGQMLDEFVRAHWTLDSDVFALLERGDVMLFVDGVDEVMGDVVARGAQFSDWLAEHNFPAIALTCRSDIAVRNLRDLLPMIRVQHLTTMQIDTLTRIVLDDQQADAFLDSMAVLSPSQLSAELLALRLLLWRVYGGDDTPPGDAFVLENAIRALYELADDSTAEHYSVQEIVDGLSRLAFRMTEQACGVYVSRSFVLEALGDDFLIQIAVHLGILQEHGDHLRFAISSLQRFLSARRLLEDGIYTRLTYPEFDATGNRKATQWDDIIIHATELLPPQTLLQTIDSIGDVDPFFAYQVVTHHQVTAADVLDDVLWKVLDARHQSATNFTATRAVVDDLQELVTFANHLISALRSDETAIVQTALQIIADLDIPLPDGLVDILQSLDMEFLDAVYDELEPYPIEDLLLGLIRLIGADDDGLREKAIFILGELQEQAAVPLLTRLAPGSESVPILERAAETLGKIPQIKEVEHSPDAIISGQNIAGTSAITYLFSLLSHENGDVVSAANWALEQHGRGASAITVRYLSAAELMDDSAWHHLIRAEESEVTKVLMRLIGVDQHTEATAIQANEVDETDAQVEGETDRMRKLLDILAEKMTVLRNKEAFTDFTEDVMTAMGASETGTAQIAALPPATSPENSPKLGLRKEELKRLEARIRNTQAIPIVPQDADAGGTLPLTDDGELPAKLLVAMEQDDWIIRQRAVRQIANYPPRVVLSVLLDAIHDPDGQVKIAVIESLPDENEFPVVLNALFEALDDDDYMVVDAAADRLRPRAGDISQRLIEHIKDSSPQALAAIIDLLGCTGDPKTVPHLTNLLTDTRRAWMEDKTLGEHAANALLGIGTVDAVSAVQSSGLVDERGILSVLPPGLEDAEPEPITAEGTMRELVATLESDEWGKSQKAAQQIRETARRLRNQPNDGVTAVLINALASETWEIRWTAAEALAWLQNDASVKPLMDALKDDHWIVKIAVVRALIELGAREAVGEIARLLYDANNAVREAAAEGLGLLGTVRVLPALEAALKDDDQFVRLAATRAVTGIDDPKARALLVKALQDTYSHVRWTAMRHLGENADETLLKVIAVHLRDKGKPEWESITVGELAERAIAGMNTTQSKQVLKKWSEIKSKR